MFLLRANQSLTEKGERKKNLVVVSATYIQWLQNCALDAGGGEEVVYDDIFALLYIVKKKG